MTSRAQPVTSYQDIDELNGSAPICEPPPPDPAGSADLFVDP